MELFKIRKIEKITIKVLNRYDKILAEGLGFLKEGNYCKGEEYREEIYFLKDLIKQLRELIKE